MATTQVPSEETVSPQQAPAPIPQAPAPAAEPPSPETGDNTSNLSAEQLQAMLDEKEAELRRVRTALKKANNEAAARRVQLKQAAGAQPEGDEDPSEADKLRAKVEELQQQIQKRDVEASIGKQKQAVLTEATSMGFLHPEDALVLGGLEFDAESPIEAEDIKTALRTLARRRPELLAPKTPPAVDATAKGTTSDIGVDEAEVARRFGIKL